MKEDDEAFEPGSLLNDLKGLKSPKPTVNIWQDESGNLAIFRLVQGPFSFHTDSVFCQQRPGILFPNFSG
jgi:hypothetical protein